MNCKDFKKNIKLFLNKKLSGDKLRQFYYHCIECKSCKDTLLDEYILYSVFNDLDKDYNFNYETRLDNELEEIYNNIVANDNTDFLKYIIYSIVICIVLIIVAFFMMRFIYR